MADEKKIATNTFQQADSDTVNHLIPPSSFRYMSAMRIYGEATSGVPTKILGNTLIPNNLPAGVNKGHGWGKNEEKGKLYLFNYNDQGYHGIYAYDILTGAITPVLLNKTDTNGADILKFDKDYPIYHVDVVADNLLYWADGLNKARKTNIAKCIDKSSSGYGSVITEDLITAYKQTSAYAPTAVYFTDLTRTSNYVYGLQFKFAIRFYYLDGEQSNVSDYSSVPLPPNESYLGQNSITFDNNCIKVSFETGSKEVSKIELLVKIDSADFVSCIILNKSQLGIADYGTYTYQFYNDGAYTAVDPVKVARPYSFLPRVPATQAFVKIAMIYARFNEGFEAVKIVATSTVSFKPFYLPSGTVSQLNNPVLTATLLSANEHGGIFNSWWTTVTHFVVGNDVKKGNVFTIICQGGNTTPSAPQNFLYTANLTDTAETVAANIKAYLRLIDAVGTGNITNENIDGSGNVSWDFTVEAHESKQPIEFTTSVTPVNYSTLLDNGLSVNTIKQGSSRKYGIVYDDDDGRTSLTYTNDALLTVTPFETETLLGQTAPIGLQQPIHTISIFNRPPIWAKYWRLVRTSDTKTFIQMLIQRVNDVVVANQPTYIDMVVGSLFTYQKIHPDTILKYEFKRGDRLRLISNENTVPATPYTPYFETEVLSYTVDEEIPVNANIRTTIGVPNANVTPSDGVKAGYVGKNIIIQGTERTIVSISGADYVLNEPITLEQATTATLYTVPNYTIVDRRGIIRIKKPTGYTITDLSLVEIYSPEQNLDNTSYLDFFDFQQKFAIQNWGTANAAHIGNVQNQDPANPSVTPAIVQVTNGDAYVRNRALPTNNQNPNPQVIIDQICDPNFSDFYESNLYNTGRVYPQDQAFGVVYFGSRVRYSNNYIEDTRINGLNDFDNTDRKDYNDPYGTITLLRFKQNYLKVYKQLRNAWTLVGQRVIKDNNGSELVATSDRLLNELEYAAWEGGIGDNPESYTENGNSEYIASVNSGVILRVAQNGSEPISTIYNYDYKIRSLLSLVGKYNLKIPAGFDKTNDDALWSVDDYINYIFNNDFNAGDWQSVLASYPSGTTWAITQQPAHSTATVVGNQIQITGTSTLGGDFFKFQGTLPDTSLTPVMNFCFTVIPSPDRAVMWAVKADTKYCEQLNVEWDVEASTAYCLKNPTFSLTAIINETGTPYSDANADMKMGGVSIPGGRVTGSGTYVFDVSVGGVLSIEAFSERPSTGSSPTKTLQAKVNGTIVYGPTTNSNNPGDASLLWNSYTPVEGDVIEISVTASATAFAPDVTGILVVDIYDDAALNVIGYVNTIGTTPYQQPVYVGNNFYPGSSTPPESNWVLASDAVVSLALRRRFEFNIAQLLSVYPSATSFEFIISGRTTSAGNINGQYQQQNGGKMIMTGSTGSYLPSTTGTTVIGTPTVYSGKPIVGGANGTYGIGVGAIILTFTYNVAAKTITLTP